MLNNIFATKSAIFWRFRDLTASIFEIIVTPATFLLYTTGSFTNLLTLAHSCSLLLSLTHSCSLWLTLALSLNQCGSISGSLCHCQSRLFRLTLTHFGCFWLSLSHSGSLSGSLRVHRLSQGPCSARRGCVAPGPVYPTLTSISRNREKLWWSSCHKSMIHCGTFNPTSVEDEVEEERSR